MQFKLTNSVIPLDPSIKLPVVLRSPLFLTEENKIPGSYIFNFSVPAGPEICEAFGQAHRVQRHGRATAELPYTIVDGTLKFSGTCLVTQSTEDKYEISCQLGNGDLSVKISGKTLKDIDWGDDIVNAELYSFASGITSMVFTYPDYPSIINSGYFCSVLMDITGALTNNGHTFTASKNISCKQIIRWSANVIEGSIWLVIEKNDVALPFETLPDGSIVNDLNLVVGDVIKVYLVGETTNSGPEYIININDISLDIEYSTPDLFSTIPELDQYSCDFALFPVHNKDFLSNWPDDAFQLDNLSIKTIYSEYAPVLNYYKDGKFPLILLGHVENELIACCNLFTPFVYMRTILRKIATSAGYSIENNPFDAEFKNMVLFNSYAENTYNSNTTTLLPVKNTFNLADHVPDIAQSDFIRWISILTGYRPVVDNDLMSIRFVNLKNRHVISESNPAIPFPGILLSKPVSKNTPEYAGIKLELTKSSQDKYLDKVKEITSKMVYRGSFDNPMELPADAKVNDYVYFPALNSYWIYQYNPETYDLRFCFYSYKFPLIYKEVIEPFLNIKTEFSPVLTEQMLDTTLSSTEYRMWTIPKVELAGTLEGFPDSFAAESSIQALYYKGMSVDSNNDPYPLGTSRMADYSTPPDNLSPDLDAYTLFQNNKSFLQWLAYDSKPFTYKAILTRAQLQQFRFDQVYSGTGFNFLAKELHIDMEMDGLSMGEIDIYTV